jgi:hypothetical protein
MRPNKLAERLLLAIAPVAYNKAGPPKPKEVAEYAIALAIAFETQVNKPAKVIKARVEKGGHA